tara:strand:+ start:16760 stop:18961 length:2202 start_codon:yes stop_codon:yes gene_type:complete
MYKDLNKQFNIPAWVKGNTPAEEAKIIQKKFKDRNDKASKETMEELLQSVANKQEYIKMQMSLANEAKQVPDQMNGQVPQGMEQFAGGGFLNAEDSIIGQGFGEDATGAQKSAAIGAGISGLATVGQLGATAFGNTGVDTSGRSNVQGQTANQGGMALKGAMQGASAGSALGPLGAAGGAIVGGVAGLIGGGRKRNDLQEAGNNNALMQNAQYSKMAYGGYADSKCGGPGQPPCSDTIRKPSNKPVGFWSQMGDQVDEIGGLFNLMANPTGGMASPNSQRAVDALRARVTDSESMFMTYQKKAFKDEKEYKEKVRQQDGVDFVNRQQNKQAFGGFTDPNKKLPGNTGPQEGGGQKNLDNLNNAMNGMNQPDLNLGSYKDYLNVHNQGVNYVINPTGSNPQNAQGFKKQMAYLQKLNPNAKLDGQYTQFQNRQAMGGYTNDYSKGGPLSTLNPYGAIGADGQEMRQYVSPVNSLQPQGLQSQGLQTQEQLTQPLTGTKYKKPFNETGAGQGLKTGLDFLGKNGGNIMQYAPIVGNLTDRVDRAKDPRREQINKRYNPDMVDEAQLQKIVENQYGNLSNSLRSASGGSGASLRANLLGASTNKNKALSDAYLKADGVNRQENRIKQQFDLGVDRLNLNQSNLDETDKQMNEGAFQTAKSAKRAALFEDLGKIGKEEVDKKLVKEMFGYSWDGKYFRDSKGKKYTQREVAAQIQTKKKDSALHATESSESPTNKKG